MSTSWSSDSYSTARPGPATAANVHFFLREWIHRTSTSSSCHVFNRYNENHAQEAQAAIRSILILEIVIESANAIMNMAMYDQYLRAFLNFLDDLDLPFTFWFRVEVYVKNDNDTPESEFGNLPASSLSSKIVLFLFVLLYNLFFNMFLFRFPLYLCFIFLYSSYTLGLLMKPLLMIMMFWVLWLWFWYLNFFSIKLKWIKNECRTEEEFYVSI